MTTHKSSTKLFRTVGLLEGISYLVLLGIAMPLKRFAGIPEAVKYTGWAHGILFMLFVALLLQVGYTQKRSFRWMAAAFIASLIPFGTFVLDRQIKKEEQALEFNKN